ncbi:MAG TPA: hypothetical protein VGM50_13395 [Gemmatimonadaceae bacterium]|jgi:hypothetical protein
MTCDNYLAMLETLPVEELNYGAAREHSAFCSDCNRVTRVVVEREQNMLMAYGHIVPSAAAGAVADSAVAAARRRRTARFYSIGLAAAGAAAILAIIVMLFAVPKRAQRATEIDRQRFALRCLSTDEAADVLRASLPDPHDDHVMVPPYEQAVIVEGDAMMRLHSREILDQREFQCLVNKQDRESQRVSKQQP